MKCAKRALMQVRLLDLQALALAMVEVATVAVATAVAMAFNRLGTQNHRMA